MRELESTNRLLRTQLQESAACFRAALETAQRHLNEGMCQAEQMAMIILSPPA